MSMCLSTPGTAFFLRIPVRLPGSDRPIAFRLRRLEQTVHRDLGARHFSCKFSRKTSPVAFPRTFRPRRLAQNGCPTFGRSCKSFKVHSWRPRWKWRSWPKSCGGPCENEDPDGILSQVLAWSCTVQVLVRRPCGYLAHILQDVLAWSCTGPYKYL